MTLRENQSKFAKMAAELILKAYELGYEVTLGDAYRDPRLHGEYVKFFTDGTLIFSREQFERIEKVFC